MKIINKESLQAASGAGLYQFCTDIYSIKQESDVMLCNYYLNASQTPQTEKPVQRTLASLSIAQQKQKKKNGS